MADENNTNNSEGYEMKMPESPVTNPNTVSAPEVTAASSAPIPKVEKHSYLAPVIGVIIVLIVLALGALYLWGAQLMDMNGSDVVEENTMMEATTTEETMTQQAPAEETFTDIDAEIDAEMEAFDAELNQMDAELEGTTTAQ